MLSENADRFIERLAGGYDAEVLERGATFSAGERQLLAFARRVEREAIRSANEAALAAINEAVTA